MFNPTKTVIRDFTRELTSMYEETYGILEPSYPGVISFVARLALENIATSDASRRKPHNYALHSLQITQEGQQWIANLYANVFSTEHSRGLK